MSNADDIFHRISKLTCKSAAATMSTEYIEELFIKKLNDDGDEVLTCTLCSVEVEPDNKVSHIKNEHPDVNLGSKTEEKKSFKSSKACRVGWVKDYCDRIEERIYRCKICRQDLRMQPGIYHNMKRHIIRKHPEVCDKERNIFGKSEYIASNETEQNFEVFDDYDVDNTEVENTQKAESTGEDSLTSDDEDEKCDKVEQRIKMLCNKPVLGKMKGKTCIWNFFKNVDGKTVYKCSFCSKHVTIFPKNVSNLTRHVTHRHNVEFQKILKYAPMDDSLFRNKWLLESDDEDKEESGVDLDDKTVEMIKELCTKSVPGKHRSKTCLWNFFECVEGMTYRCMFCSRQIAISHLRGVGNLRRHVMRIHKKQYEVIVKYAPDTDSLHRGRSGVFLKTISSGDLPTSSAEFQKTYFDEVSDGIYLCKHCDETIECNEDNSDILFNHIQDKHPDQVVMYQEQTEDTGEFSLFIVKK